MKKIPALASLVLSASLVTPLLALAQTGIDTSVITPYSDGIIKVVNEILVPVLMAIAFIVFLRGVYKYFIAGAEKDTERAEGRQFVLWGIIGFVVILSVWGLVAIVRNTFGLTTDNAPTPPTFNPSFNGSSNNSSGNWF